MNFIQKYDGIEQIDDNWNYKTLHHWIDRKKSCPNMFMEGK